MSSSWGKKLDKKLDGLPDTASKESIQTLANWIAFNRKHSETIATALTSALQNFMNNEKRQWLFWQLIHEVLIRDNGNASKWEKLGDLRIALGEALQPSMKILGNTMPDELETYLEEWEDLDVFGGPSVNSQIRRLYQSRKNVTPKVENSDSMKTSGTPGATLTGNLSEDNTTKTQSSLSPTIAQPEPSSESLKSPNKNMDLSETQGNSSPEADQKERLATTNIRNETNRADSSKIDDNKDAKIDIAQQKIEQGTQKNPSILDQSEDGKSTSPLKRRRSEKEQIEYDFESKGVPPGPVESRDFLDPCKAITTLQIARDVRTNTAIEISTALKNLPADILTACEDLQSGKSKELSAAAIDDFSIRIPSSLLDLDLDEEKTNLNMFEDIVQRQQKAREQLLYLLQKSRCNFGSREAASEFYEIDNLLEKIKKRKELLSDALELEGLDTNEIDNEIESNNKGTVAKKDNEEELSPLTWYTEEKSTSQEQSESSMGSNKKQKVA